MYDSLRRRAESVHGGWRWRSLTDLQASCAKTRISRRVSYDERFFAEDCVAPGSEVARQFVRIESDVALEELPIRVARRNERDRASLFVRALEQMIAA